MVVTLQLVATDSTADAIEVSSEIVLADDCATGGNLADAVARRARDAALQLLEHLPEPASGSARDFVPLADVLPRI
jgi:hypothetical protein